MEFYATCPTGFERLLADELVRMGTPRVRPLQGRVSFEGTLADAYAVCLRSHLASRVVAVLARIAASDADELYEGARGIAWEQHVPANTTFAVFASGTNAQLKNTQFVAVRVKDAIADTIRAKVGTRPVVDTKAPQVRVVARIAKNRATLGIDLVGDPLFMRGYQRSSSPHGLRPDYAAALLMAGGWPQQYDSADEVVLVDASPAPSTILVEAGLLLARRAPGLLRLRWGFLRWGLHDAQAWDAAIEQARAQERECPGAHLLVQEGKGTYVSRTHSALRASGLELDVHALGGAHEAETDNSLVACDLSRMEDADLAQEAGALTTLLGLAGAMGAQQLAVASTSALPTSFVQDEPHTQVRTKLGQHELLLGAYTFAPDRQRPCVSLSPTQTVPVLVPTSDQFAARLKKAARLRAKWARREDVTCYRVYDSDLPDYAVAIDLYAGTDPQTGMPNGRRWLLVSEYAAPKDIDPALARSRLVDVLTIAPSVLDVSPHNVFLRVRRKARGGSQYAQEGRQQPRQGRTDKSRGKHDTAPGGHLIDEGGLTFEVNFSSYLDCGIFLDHRTTRSMIREMAKQTQGSKRFLNLFAYTGTATCYAADGGARHTTTVDLSRTYLDWARRNMARNGFEGREHEYVQADVVRWASEQRHTKNRWDLVFCDVPTFSNSSRMGKRSFDVQRDHAELLITISRLLTRNGVCVFSCNLRSFAPDVKKLERAGVELTNITAQTIPEDFARNPRIHHTYLVRRKA